MREQKSDRFRRVVEARVNKLIKMIRLLGNCSNQSVYAYTPDQVKQVFTVLQTELNQARERYTNGTKSGRKRFSLTEPHVPAYLSQPHLVIQLPDGSQLIAAAFPAGDYPAINLYWLSEENESEQLIGFAEFNPERDPGYNLCVGTYQSDQEDTTYYEPYNGRKESE